MNNRIAKCFLIGCPRSGTTLLQSMLAAHPAIYSLPETHFFVRTKSRHAALAALGMTDTEMRQDLEEKFSGLLSGSGWQPRGYQKLLTRNYVSAFVRRLDGLTRDANKSLWLEKTPQHLHRIEMISRYVDNARFVHIVRNGRDTISSLYAVTNRYPKRWGGARSLDECIQRWTKDIRISHSCMFLENHLIISYQRLVATPIAELARICRFLEIDYSESMITSFQNSYTSVVREHDAEWTDKAGQPLGTHSGHFDTALEKPEQERVRLAESQFKHVLDELVVHTETR